MTLTIQQLKEGVLNDPLNVLPVCDILESKNANGEVFYVSVNTALNTLSIADPITISMLTPDSDNLACVSIIAIVTAGAILEVFEDNGVLTDFNVSGGVSMIPFNRNRCSCAEGPSEFILYSGVTVTAATAAVALPVKRVGGLLGGEMAHRPGLVLKKNTKYLFRIASDANFNEGTLVLTWYIYHCNL